MFLQQNSITFSDIISFINVLSKYTYRHMKIYMNQVKSIKFIPTKYDRKTNITWFQLNNFVADDTDDHIDINDLNQFE